MGSPLIIRPNSESPYRYEGEIAKSPYSYKAILLELVLDIVFVAVGRIAGNEFADKTGKE